jgi:hypothetical protein
MHKGKVRLTGGKLIRQSVSMTECQSYSSPTWLGVSKRHAMPVVLGMVSWLLPPEKLRMIAAAWGFPARLAGRLAPGG